MIDVQGVSGESDGDGRHVASGFHLLQTFLQRLIRISDGGRSQISGLMKIGNSALDNFCHSDSFGHCAAHSLQQNFIMHFSSNWYSEQLNGIADIALALANCSNSHFVGSDGRIITLAIHTAIFVRHLPLRCTGKREN
jgi:hypothetical protein